ncbi:MAG: hypothetical protein NZ108_07215, partial [Bacteroidia bacterium]|nr:hypothetical protein [Bacteroidia bacterium]
VLLSTLQAQLVVPVSLVARNGRTHHYFSWLTHGGGNGGVATGAGIFPQLSAQTSVDANFQLTDNGHVENSLALSLRYNPIITTRTIQFDSFNVKKLALVENEHLLYLQAGRRWIKDNGMDGKAINSLLFDAAYTPYNVERKDSSLSQTTSRGIETVKFWTFQAMASYQFSYYTYVKGIGDLLFSFSGQTSFLQISDKEASGISNSAYMNARNTGFDRLIEPDTLTRVTRSYVGVGGKVLLQINDIGLFFEARKYFSTGGGGANILQLTEPMIFSFGAVISGAVLKNYKSAD